MADQGERVEVADRRGAEHPAGAHRLQRLGDQPVPVVDLERRPLADHAQPERDLIGDRAHGAVGHVAEALVEHVQPLAVALEATRKDCLD